MPGSWTVYDPDKWSPRLREYHRRLWSRPLPGGARLVPEAIGQLGAWTTSYLTHRSELGEFVLHSDALVGPFMSHRQHEPLASIIRELEPAEVKHYDALGYTIGGS